MQNHSAEGFFSEKPQDWQIICLGFLLGQYRVALAQSFDALLDDIQKYTGQDIGDYQRVSRLVRVAKKGKQGYEQNTTDTRFYNIIASFLAHPQIGLLILDHLKFRNFPTVAPVAFINTLLFDLDQKLPCLHPSYAGTYKIRSTGESQIDNTQLSLSINPDKEWFVVRMRQAETVGRKKTQQILFHDGWGVMLPEDGLFIHIKHSSLGKNKLFSTPVSPLNFASRRCEDALLIIQNQSNTFEIQNWPALLETPDENQRNNTYIFQWDNENFFSYEADFGIMDKDDKEIVKNEDKWNVSLDSDDPLLKNSRFADTQKASDSGKDLLNDFIMQHKERYLGQRFIEAVQDIRIDENELGAILDGSKALNAQDPFNGCTALHCTVANQNEVTSLWLLDQDGIDLTIQDRKGRTPAMLAAIVLDMHKQACLFDQKFVDTLRNKEVEQIRQKMEAGDPDLPPAYQTRENE